MNVLIACEYSARVRDAFRLKGHDAWSCDLLPTDRDPAFHHQGDIKAFINSRRWDLMICHPPCTYLTGAAEWAFSDKPMINGKPRRMKMGVLFGEKRRSARIEALEFVDLLWNADIDKICLENPVGVIPKNRWLMPKPQYIQQYWFGEDASKKTGLWLKNLPPLTPTNEIQPRIVNGLKRWGNQTDSGQNNLPPSADRWKIRSTTPQGIANAMAEQWG